MSDALTLAGRAVRLSRRQLDALLMALVLPVLLMILFVELFGGAIQTGTRYVTYVVPGVLLLCASYSSGLTAVSICQDMTGGIIDRLRSMDVPARAMFAGHLVASAARNMVSAALVIAVALLLGFHPHAGLLDWLGAAGVVLAFAIAISAVSALLGLFASSAEAANGYTFLIMFLPYASSAFVPVRTMPAWLHGFAAHQPITPIAETLRALLVGGAAGANAWIGLAWCAGLTAGSLAAAGFAFARRAG